MLSTAVERRQAVVMGRDLGRRYVKGCGACNSSCQFRSALHVTTSSEHLPSFHDIFIHITYVPKPLRPHVPFCPASPSIGVVHLASSPLAAASRRSTHPSPLAHPPHFANGTPAQATSENRSVKELDRSCSTSLLDLTRGAEDAERPCAM